MSTESDRGTDLLERHRMAATEVLKRVSALVGDEWVSDTSAGDIVHVNPTTGEAQQRVAKCGPAEVDSAVEAATRMSSVWRDATVDVRRQTLLRIAAGLRDNVNQLALMGVLEMGAPIAGARGAVMKTADYFEYFAGWADKIHGQVVPVYPSRAFDYTSPEPYGVIAAILNWNGPLTAIARKVAPALAAGNCVVMKSPELAPFTTRRFAEICVEAGLPLGVLSALTGDGETGAALVGHRGVGKISFTGSAGTARLVMAAASRNLTPLTLELGGKSANLVFADSDLDAAIRMAAHFGAVQGAGQGCLLPTRLMVEEPAYDRVVEGVVEYLQRTQVGDPLLPGTVMGPVINAAACSRILATIESGKNSGASLLTGGDRLSGSLAGGFFVEPTAFGNVDNASQLAQGEIFGPVLSIIRFKDQDEAVKIANASSFGLAAYIHTREVSRAHDLAARLNAGYISINGFNPMPPTAPFGGQGESGFGREGGFAGLSEFLRPKNVYLNL
jgi:aldehyde dehydrogenase (NAD+)